MFLSSLKSLASRVWKRCTFSALLGSLSICAQSSSAFKFVSKSLSLFLTQLQNTECMPERGRLKLLMYLNVLLSISHIYYESPFKQISDPFFKGC